MKNMLKKLSIIFIALLVAFTAFYVSKVTAESEDDSGKNFFEASSNDVTINNEITGDVFVVSGGTVTINNHISGNVFICARNVVISENAEISSSLFNASQKIQILGHISGNVYSASQDFELDENSSLALDLFLGAETINFNGNVSRSAYISGRNIQFGQFAYINENLDYSSSEEVAIPENIVGGKITYKAIAEDDSDDISVSSIIYSCISFTIFTIVIFLILKWLNSKAIDENKDFTKNIGKYLLYGLLGLILIPIACLVLTIMGITINLSLLLLAIYFIILLVASSITIITLSNLCKTKFGEKMNMNDTLKTVLFIVVLAIIYKLLRLIPILGGILALAAAIIGTGICIKCTIPEKKAD